MVLIHVKLSIRQPKQAQLILENHNVNLSGTKKSHLESSFRLMMVVGRYSIWFGNLMNSICQVRNVSCRHTSHAEIGT